MTSNFNTNNFICDQIDMCMERDLKSHSIYNPCGRHIYCFTTHGPRDPSSGP